MDHSVLEHCLQLGQYYRAHFNKNDSVLCVSCRNDKHSQEVKIALVGKYTQLEDAYISVIKSLKHAALSCRLNLKLDCISAEDLEEDCHQTDPIRYHESWKVVCAANGIIVPGGFGVRGIEGKILAAKYARERKIPYLGEWIV